MIAKTGVLTIVLLLLFLVLLAGFCFLFDNEDSAEVGHLHISYSETFAHMWLYLHRKLKWRL